MLLRLPRMSFMIAARLRNRLSSKQLLAGSCVATEHECYILPVDKLCCSVTAASWGVPPERRLFPLSLPLTATDGDVAAAAAGTAGAKVAAGGEVGGAALLWQHVPSINELKTGA